MVFAPDWLETPTELRTKTIDQKDLVFLSGYAAFRFEGREFDLIRDDIYIPVGPIWRELKVNEVVASVGLASISSHRSLNFDIDDTRLPHDIPGRGDKKIRVPGDPFNLDESLWAVDNCRISKLNDQILLQCAVAVGGIGSILWKLVYHVNAIGFLS